MIDQRLQWIVSENQRFDVVESVAEHVRERLQLVVRQIKVSQLRIEFMIENKRVLRIQAVVRQIELK